MSESSKILKIETVIKNFNGYFIKERLKLCLFKMKMPHDIFTLEHYVLATFVSIIVNIGLFITTDDIMSRIHDPKFILFYLLVNVLVYILSMFVTGIFLGILSLFHTYSNKDLMKLIYPVKDIINNNQMVEDNERSQPAKFLIQYYEVHKKLPIEDKKTIDSVFYVKGKVVEYLRGQQLEIKNRISNSLRNGNGENLE
jgi:hypothetical protein